MEESPNIADIVSISISDVSEEFFNEVGESYNKDPDAYKVKMALSKDFKDKSLIENIGEPWKKGLLDGRFTMWDELLYHRTKYSGALVIVNRDHINFILMECHDTVYSGHLSEDRTFEKVRITAWWPGWRKDVIEYCSTCERCQKANRTSGKKFGMLQ